MASVLEMPKVADCTVTSCSYNHDGCHAYAITVAEEASCATFVEMPLKGGVDPTLTILANAYRVADHFVREAKRQNV